MQAKEALSPGKPRGRFFPSHFPGLVEMRDPAISCLWPGKVYSFRRLPFDKPFDKLRGRSGTVAAPTHLPYRVVANIRCSRRVGATSGRPRDYNPPDSAGGQCPPLRIFLTGWLQISAAPLRRGDQCVK